MMKNKIEILSPGKGCWKTRKIIRSMKKFFSENHLEAEFIIIDDADKYPEYDTWILPTVVINGKVTARGYRPTNTMILNNLYQ